MITHSPMGCSSAAQLDADFKVLRSLAQRDPEFAEVIRVAAQAAIEEWVEAVA